MNKRFKQWINSALDFVFPQHLKCHSCSKEAAVNEYGICSECEAGLAVNPLAEQIEFVDEYAAGLFYNDVSKRAVYALKYNGAVYVREFLTHFMCIPADWPIDCIVPVPLHPRRERNAASTKVSSLQNPWRKGIISISVRNCLNVCGTQARRSA